jgi:hypothetical protein
MATKDQVFRTDYFTIMMDDRAGQGADLGRKLGKENVNLLAVLAFPVETGKVQIDLVPEHPDDLMKAARKLGLSLSGPKTAFLLQGTDRAGAMGDILERLSSAGISARAGFGVGSGSSRFGGMLWVAQSDVEAASRALGATSMVKHHV